MLQEEKPPTSLAHFELQMACFWLAFIAGTAEDLEGSLLIVGAGQSAEHFSTQLKPHVWMQSISESMPFTMLGPQSR